MAQGREEDHRRPGRAPGVLRLPRRALDPSADHEPHRVHVLHDQAADEGHPRSGQPGRRPGDGVQARRGRPGPLAGGHRTPPRRPRPLRRPLRKRPPRRGPRSRLKLNSPTSLDNYSDGALKSTVEKKADGTTLVASHTYAYDRNRLLSATADGVTANYNYDPFGRQESVTSGGKVIERSVYDGFDHVVESQKTDDAGAMKSTTYTFDPLDRTASKTADGKTTDFEYLGLSGEVLDEKVAGKLTKSYQYSPWGERLSQIKHNTDGTTEDGYYGYNSHTDVETLTDSSGNTKATYGYTAYGSEDESEFTGIDKPDANDPTKETYNPYRYNAKRWDAQSGTYDMGFRDYNPGLNRFTTRDMYNGALADMNLGVDPYTGNRYAFTGGNPTSFVEFDGHFSITDIAKDVLKFAGKRNPVGLVSSVSGLLFDFDPVGDAVDTVVGEIFGETESRWYQAKDYDKGRFLTPDGEVETDPGIGSGDLPPSCLNGGQTWVFYQPLDDQGRATGMHACLNKGDFNYSKDNGEAAFPDNDATAIWGSKAPWPVEDWGDNPKGIKSGMHRGHLLARQLGGDGEDRRNLVPLYARVNTPEMRDIETEIAERIQGNETILYSVIPDYGSGGNVPTTLTLTAVGNKGYRLNYPLINQP
ncbi:DNA/RNA non-specific endonuclease [Streptomyces sp. AC04842]|nr:DNA/RNA non-specific endonuclease [Streptomyces sp. AC04842]